MFHHKAKKSLGQNFLKSALALKNIVEAGKVNPGDIILEIGPGRGALTEKLLLAGGQVIAVEKDPELAEYIRQEFHEYVHNGQLRLIEGDILDFDTGILGDDKKSYKIIANIPYNITGAILKKFLTSKLQPKTMVLLLQKEVADRILAQDGKQSLLSISVRAYGEPRKIMKVEARYFSPAPKVDSAVIAIYAISRKFFIENSIDEARFWEIVRAGFAHKRKKLASNLKKILRNSLLQDLKDKRAEDLTLLEWGKLAQS